MELSPGKIIEEYKTTAKNFAVEKHAFLSIHRILNVDIQERDLSSINESFYTADKVLYESAVNYLDPADLGKVNRLLEKNQENILPEEIKWLANIFKAYRQYKIIEYARDLMWQDCVTLLKKLASEKFLAKNDVVLKVQAEACSLHRPNWEDDNSNLCLFWSDGEITYLEMIRCEQPVLVDNMNLPVKEKCHNHTYAVILFHDAFRLRSELLEHVALRIDDVILAERQSNKRRRTSE